MHQTPDESGQLIERLTRRAERERSARREAERLLEEKSRELFDVNESLRMLTATLERQVAQRTAELSEALAHTRAATEAKSDFLATMSHEIRTPLNGMLGMVQLLELGDLAAEQSRYVKLIRTSGNALLELLNDILDFSRIEAGKLELEDLPFSLRDFAADIEAFNRPLFQASGLGFAVVIDPALPDRLRGDVGRLRQVLLNLLSNARKFTREGRVTLDIGLTTLHAGSAGLRLSVIDTGIGIAHDKQESIFSAFSQADASTAREFGGSGLGLAICARLVQAMGGTVRVDSEPGQGTCFTVDLSLPCAESLPGGAIMDPYTAVDGNLPDIGVLIVDDNELNCFVLTEMLRRIGWNADVVHDGRSAVARAEQRRYGLILMDIHMPGMNGLEATAAIRELPLAEQPLIVAVTADASRENLELCGRVGIDDVITKPLQMTDIQAAMARFTKVRSASGAASTP